MEERKGKTWSWAFWTALACLRIRGKKEVSFECVIFAIDEQTLFKV